MAINTSRARRQNEIATAGSTSEHIGPGSYSNTYNEPKAPAMEAPVPFLSMQERNLNVNRGTSAITPGPGNYRSDMTSLSQHAPTSLQSKVKRLGPTAPGSSVFTSSTIEKNPGPGTYAKATHGTLGRSQEKPLMAPTRPVLEALEKTTPSMPLMKLKPGQRPDNEGDNDVAKFIMRHTGERGDNAGPGEYDPHNGYQLLTRSQPQPSFHSSKLARNLWERTGTIECKVAPRDVPGPGAYAHALVFNEQKRNDDEEDVTTSTYQFASGSALAYQIQLTADKVNPGPGQYDLVGGIDKSLKSARHRSATRGEMTQFGSMTERLSMMSRSAREPYNDPYHLHHVPGPGHYPTASFVPEDPKLKEAEKVLPDSRRKKIYGVHHPTIVMALCEAQGPLQAFNSTDDRPCNKSQNQGGPSPWQYNRESARGQSMGAELRERAKVGRRGAFGSCSDRFYGSPLNGKTGLPDPSGDGFDGMAATAAAHSEPRSAFQSSTPRFVAAAGPKEEQVVKVGNTDTPAPGQYMVETEPNYRSPFRQPRVEHLSFGSAKARFDPSHEHEHVFYGHMKGASNPGPCEYDWEKITKRTEGAGLPKAARTKVIVGGTSETVGPGSYGYIETHLLKKTYNVSTQARVSTNGSEMASARTA